MKKSVAICTYNGEKYFVRQIESILNQTVKIDEIIICDDVSTDKTHEILAKYQSKFPDLIKVIFNEKNLGYIKNFEKAISLCTGEIIFLSDQDDIWLEHKVESIINIFNSKPDVCYVFSDAIAIDENGNNLNYNIWTTINFNKKKQIDFRNGKQAEYLIENNFVTGATLAIRSEKKETIFPFPDNVPHDYWIAFLLSSINNYSGWFSDEPLIKYRIHKKQIVGLPKATFWESKIMFKLRVFLKSHYEYYNERIDFLTPVNLKLEKYNIKNKISFLITDFIDYYTIRNEMYISKRKKSFLLIKKLNKMKYYSKFTRSKIYAITRDFIEKVLLNRNV